MRGANMKIEQKQFADLYVPVHTDELLGYKHVQRNPHTGISSNVRSIELQQMHLPGFLDLPIHMEKYAQSYP